MSRGEFSAEGMSDTTVSILQFRLQQSVLRHQGGFPCVIAPHVIPPTPCAWAYPLCTALADSRNSCLPSLSSLKNLCHHHESDSQSVVLLSSTSYNDPTFFEECKQEYIREKLEFERTGIPAKNRKQKLPTSM